MEYVASAKSWAVSPLGNAARRAERRSELWLELFCKVFRCVADLFLATRDELTVFLLDDVPRVGFVSLPRLRCGPLLI